jgi:hypothetical protein
MLEEEKKITHYVSSFRKIAAAFKHQSLFTSTGFFLVIIP